MKPCGFTPSGAHRARHRPAVPCGTDVASLHYERHHPEQTTLSRIVQQQAASPRLRSTGLCKFFDAPRQVFR